MKLFSTVFNIWEYWKLGYETSTETSLTGSQELISFLSGTYSHKTYNSKRDLLFVVNWCLKL
jgi:hypothetical protein